MAQHPWSSTKLHGATAARAPLASHPGPALALHDAVQAGACEQRVLHGGLAQLLQRADLVHNRARDRTAPATNDERP